MMALIGVVLLASISGALIWKRNGDKLLFRERGWALVILTIGTLLIMARLFHLPIPNPTDAIKALTGPIYRPIIAWIEEDTLKR